MKKFGFSSGFSRWFWGMFFLLAGAFVLVNQFTDFTEMGVGSIIIVSLAAAFALSCIICVNLPLLPIPLAVVYIVTRNHFGLPDISSGILLLTAALASVGLAIISPKKSRHKYFSYTHHRTKDSAAANTDTVSSNTPVVSVQFGSINRYVQADALEAVQLDCNFGSLEIFFDQAQLHSNGAEATVNCNFGSIELVVPKHWIIVDNLTASVGNVSIQTHTPNADSDNAPKLTIKGKVSCGNFEVRRGA